MRRNLCRKKHFESELMRLNILNQKNCIFYYFNLIQTTEMYYIN